jgi:hypothetical protein
VLAAHSGSHHVPEITDAEKGAIGFATVFFAAVSGVAMNTAVVINEVGKAMLLSASYFGRAPKRIVVAYGF